MKLGAIVLSIIFTVMSINVAISDSRRSRYYNHYRGHGYHYNSHHDYGFSGNYSFGPRRYHGYFTSHGHYAAYALGGLIIGGIIGATISHSFKGPRYPSYGESAYYVTPYPTTNMIKPSYIMQPNGICYLISHVNNGNLVLSPASPGSCQ